MALNRPPTADRRSLFREAEAQQGAAIGADDFCIARFALFEHAEPQAAAAGAGRSRGARVVFFCLDRACNFVAQAVCDELITCQTIAAHVVETTVRLAAIYHVGGAALRALDGDRLRFHGSEDCTPEF